MRETNRNSGKNQPEEKLEQAIERMMAGESLDTVLTRAGSNANWLEPLLILAAEVQDVGETISVPPAKASLAQFLAEAERMAPTASVAPATLPWWERLTDGLRFPSPGMPRLAGTAVSVALTVIALMVSSAFLLGGNSVAAAQNVLPGQPLYPIKRLGEEMYLWLPQSSESRDARSSEYEQRRRDEVHILLGHHLEAPVTFRGMVETVGPNQIVVSGISVDITKDTEIEEPFEIGASLLVVARTARGGSLIAKSILVEQPAQPVIAPSSTDTVQPTATPTTIPSATPTPTATSTPESSATPQPMSSQTEESTKPSAPTAVDTREPEPEPPEEPSEPPDEDENENGDVEGGDENDNSDDDSDDNGDENANDNGDDDSNENEDENGGDDGDDDNDSGDGDDDSDDNSDQGSGGDSGDDGNDKRDDSSEENSGEDSNDNKSGSESRGDSGGNENDNAAS